MKRRSKGGNEACAAVTTSGAPCRVAAQANGYCHLHNRRREASERPLVESPVVELDQWRARRAEEIAEGVDGIDVERLLVEALLFCRDVRDGEIEDARNTNNGVVHTVASMKDRLAANAEARRILQFIIELGLADAEDKTVTSETIKAEVSRLLAKS